MSQSSKWHKTATVIKQQTVIYLRRCGMINVLHTGPEWFTHQQNPQQVNYFHCFVYHLIIKQIHAQFIWYWPPSALFTMLWLVMVEKHRWHRRRLSVLLAPSPFIGLILQRLHLKTDGVTAAPQACPFRCDRGKHPLFPGQQGSSWWTLAAPFIYI